MELMVIFAILLALATSPSVAEVEKWEIENSLFNLDNSQTDDHHHHYTDQWAVHIPGGPDLAESIAQKHGFTNTGEILPDYYHFVHRRVAKRSIEPASQFHDLLSSTPEVKWHEQQRAKRRSKRDFLPEPQSFKGSGGRGRNVKRSKLVGFNDPRWSLMWYLNRGPALDMNVNEAWGEGITGKGIVVTILDDGLEKDHPDIIRNYDPLASYDVNSLDQDPMPTYDLTDSNRHGTRCAGEVAAEANNSICAVGIAFEASVGGVRMLDGDVTDAVEARSLSHNPQHIDIYSASWGPDDDGKTVDGPGELATRAFMEGVTKGRGGKGSIFVWASGNGGRDHDNCNCDGYTNSIWTLSISSATENGLVPWYSEACSSTLATTYSSGGTGERQIVTIDLHHSCTSSHTGTSASAPLAAGICALALQANTNLTWRDMQHIVVRTARPTNLIAPDWATNGVGRNVSHSFGYGLMDAGAMVKLAKKWKTVPEQNKCEVRAPYTEKNIPAKSKVTLDLKVTNCTGVNFLEHVQAKVTLTSGRRGDLQIFLVSPSGTRSCLLAHRRHDLNRSGFTDWPFMTVHNWGESPTGKWTLEIHNEGRYAGRTVLKRWSLIVYGTEEEGNENGLLTPYYKVPSPRSSNSTSLRRGNESSAREKSPASHPSNFSGLSRTNSSSSSSGETKQSHSSPSPPIVIPKKPVRPRLNKERTKLYKIISKKQKQVGSPPVDPTTTTPGLSFQDTNTSASPPLVSPSGSRADSGVSEVSSGGNASVVVPLIVSEKVPQGRRDEGNGSLSGEGGSWNSSQPTTTTTVQPVSSSGGDQGAPTAPFQVPISTLNPLLEVGNGSEGRLQTWTLIAHGIREEVNGSEVKGEKKKTAAAGTAAAAAEPPPIEFDGSENSIVIQPSHVHSPPLAANAQEAADVSDSIGGLGGSPNCAIKASGKCLACVPGLALTAKNTCVAICPEGTFKQAKSLRPEDSVDFSGSFVCLPCHYSCRSCSGPNDYECTNCHGDSELQPSKVNKGHFHCYPVVLIESLNSKDFWYRVVLYALLCNLVILTLIFLLVKCKQKERLREGEGQKSWLARRDYSRISINDEDGVDKGGRVGDEIESDEETSKVLPQFKKGQVKVHYSHGGGQRVMSPKNFPHTIVATPVQLLELNEGSNNPHT